MKTYVFLTFAVHGIGGTQIYVRNKLLYLQKHGWKVKVITCEPGDNIMVKELAPYANDIVPAIAKNPGLFSHKEREDALTKMVAMIGERGPNVIIESDFMGATPWGEMLAERLNARHLILLIQETYTLHLPKYQRFFAWKYDRRELAINTPEGAVELLSGYRSIPQGQSPFLQPYCHNVVEDCKSPELDSLIEPADFHIGSIGRVNKPFVLPMVKQVRAFAEQHIHKTFQLVLFGGTDNQQEIGDILAEQCGNLKISITGALFPVPLHLLQKMDVFVASAGAARTSYEAGGITISIDANDFQPIGIMGRDTNETIARPANVPAQALGKLLEEILFSDKLFPKPPAKIEDIDKEFDKHIAFMDGMTPTQAYYDCRRLWPSFPARLKYLFLHKNE